MLTQGEKMTLSEQISARSREIHTDGYSMSIGELIALYSEGDIEVHPEFQRVSRWTNQQKTRLIESIMLGIPIPPVFVSQRENGIWDVVDGVQRLSTIFEFVGVYVDEQGDRVAPSALGAGDYLSELQDKVWKSDDPETSLPELVRREFKRKSLDIRIVENEPERDTRLDLFQRLNSGSGLTPEEARGCILLMVNPSMFDTLSRLSQSPDFLLCTPLSDSQENSSYRSELVLRFFCQLDQDAEGRPLRRDYGDHITAWMRSAAGAEPTRKGQNRLAVNAPTFDRTFELLRAALGEDVFRRFADGRHIGPFSIAGFETITAGVAHNLPLWQRRSAAQLSSRIQALWSEAFVRENSGSEISSQTRMPRLVVHGRRHFGELP